MKNVQWILHLFFVLMLLLLSGCGGGSSPSQEGSTSANVVPETVGADNTVSSESAAPVYSSALASEENKTEVTLLVLYNTKAAEASNGDIEAKVYQHIAMSNAIYQESGVEMYLRVVKMQSYSIDNTIPSPDALSIVASDQNISQLREQYKADEVVLFRDFAGDGFCGVAYQNNALQRSLGYAHITIGCPTYVLAHELGHTMGLVHSKDDPFHGRTAYARGYKEENDFATVMAYTTGTAVKINKFSSPDLTCHYSQCGIEAGETGEADAARSLRESMQAVANFYQ